MGSVVLFEGIEIPCEKIRRVFVEEGDDYIVVRDSSDTSIGVYLEYDLDKVIAVVQFFEGPIEDDALRSEVAFYIDPERCEVVEE